MSGVKCINRSIAFLCIVCLSFTLVGCGNVSSSYDMYASSYEYGISHHNTGQSGALFASNLCIADDSDIGLERVDAQIAQGGCLFNTVTKETLYAQNLHQRLFPASTTKILTAYVALKYGNLEDTYTVSEKATDQGADASVCHLKTGDRLTLRQLLYGLILCSGNDAAVTIAEGISGSEEAFADLMNQEARLLGATNSHFVTSSGLHDDQHYTTVYDMYLIFSKAIENDIFVDIMHTMSYDAFYTNAAGNPVSQTWRTTNRYLTGRAKTPEGITVIGGKSGTTWDAGYCLVLLSRNQRQERIISIVYHADSRNNLYYLMNEILYQYGNS